MFRVRWLSSVGILVVAASGSALAASSATKDFTFQLFPNPAFVACLAADGKTPTVVVSVHRGLRNDHLRLTLKHFKSGVGLDLFTVQRSNQQSDGNAVADFPGFGLAWYQSDAVTSRHTSKIDINTILLDQIFGFDPDVGLVPTQTLHVGLWFDDPAAAEPCGFTGPPTPFNGTHNAGPLAFISRPDATTGLGPLCTNPNTSTIPATCNP